MLARSAPESVLPQAISVALVATIASATTAAPEDKSNDNLYKYLTVGVLSLTAVGIAIVRCCATRRRVNQAEINARRDNGISTAAAVLDAVERDNVVIAEVLGDGAGSAHEQNGINQQEQHAPKKQEKDKKQKANNSEKKHKKHKKDKKRKKRAKGGVQHIDDHDSEEELDDGEERRVCTRCGRRFITTSGNPICPVCRPREAPMGDAAAGEDGGRMNTANPVSSAPASASSLTSGDAVEVDSVLI